MCQILRNILGAKTHPAIHKISTISPSYSGNLAFHLAHKKYIFLLLIFSSLTPPVVRPEFASPSDLALRWAEGLRILVETFIEFRCGFVTLRYFAYHFEIEFFKFHL